MNKSPYANPLITRGLKLSHLRIMAEFATTAHIGQAADALGMTQPAASRLLAEVERICGHPVHTRSGRGAQLTDVGRALAHRAAQVLLELHSAAREVESLGHADTGQVNIGAVTAPALDLVLPAVRAAHMAYPKIQIDVTVAASTVLFDQLLSGQLDFIIARIPARADKTRVTAIEVAPEPIRLVARKDHPLARKPDLALPDLARFDWILPARGAPVTEAVLARLAALGHPPPIQRLTTSSFLLTLAVLQQTNAIAPLAAAVAAQFAAGNDRVFVPLPLDLGMAVSPYAILTRRGGHPPLAAQKILAIVQEIVAHQA